MDPVSDYVWAIRVTAVTPSATVIEFCWLADTNTIEGKNYDVKRLTEFCKITYEKGWTVL
jgi:hypothetical protein